MATKKKQTKYDIYKDQDLMNQFFENIFRLFKELTGEWTINDIKMFISNLDLLDLHNAYKTYMELFLSPYYLIFSLRKKEELEKAMIESNELFKKHKELTGGTKEEVEKYFKVIEENNFIIHLKDAFPKIYNKILELEENKLAEFKMKYINIKITQDKFSEIVANNDYDQSFLIFLPKFRIKGNEIARKSFIAACSNAK